VTGNNSDPGRPDYGNWVTVHHILIPVVLGFLFLVLSIPAEMLVVPAVFFFVASVYFAYARYAFSARGGNVQAGIHDLVLGYLDWDGRGQLLDIGCGNAPLTIKAARKYPQSRVTGIDYWGGVWKWVYSQEVCERNARIEGVADRVTFQRASASALPFPDGFFDAAVSNLVFHEVADARNKRDVIREALRVVKKGGVFAFQDLFFNRKLYGEAGDLLETIHGWGIEQVNLSSTKDSTIIPRALKLPFMVGTMGVLYGRK